MTPLTELRVNHIRGLLRDARARRGDSEFVIEGPHLLEAAIEKAPKLIEYAAFTQDAVVRHGALLDMAERLDITGAFAAGKACVPRIGYRGAARNLCGRSDAAFFARVVGTLSLRSMACKIPAT